MVGKKTWIAAPRSHLGILPGAAHPTVDMLNRLKTGAHSTRATGLALRSFSSRRAVAISAQLTAHG